MRKEHIFPFKIDKYKRYQYEIVPWFKWMPARWFRYLEGRFGWHTLIRCKLKIERMPGFPIEKKIDCGLKPVNY
jgi:hypothetical protein